MGEGKREKGEELGARGDRSRDRVVTRVEGSTLFCVYKCVRCGGAALLSSEAGSFCAAVQPERLPMVELSNYVQLSPWPT